MLLDPVALAWASWLGLLVSVVGLGFTFREARGAKLAAESVAKVVAQSRARTRLSALSSAVSRATELQTRIDQSGLSSDQSLFTEFRRDVMLVVAIGSKMSGMDATRGIGIERALDAIAALIVSDVEEKQKRAQMKSRLGTISSFLIAQESLAKTEDLA